MIGEHMRMVREQYGESQLEFGQRLGIGGAPDTVRREVRKLESGEKPIAGPLAVLLRLLGEPFMLARVKKTRVFGHSSRGVQALGGKARAAALSPERRREIAQKAAQARWGNKEGRQP